MSVCWDLALASPRPPTLWLKQIPSSEPPPSLYLYLAVSNGRHETHYIKHQASPRKDPLVAVASSQTDPPPPPPASERALIDIKKKRLDFGIKRFLHRCLERLTTDIGLTVFASYPFHYYDR